MARLRLTIRSLMVLVAGVALLLAAVLWLGEIPFEDLDLAFLGGVLCCGSLFFALTPLVMLWHFMMRGDPPPP